MNTQESKKLEDKTKKTLTKNLKKSSKVIIGVSGGMDSVFLLSMLLEFQKTTPIKIIVAHINHSLRGKESDKDEKFAKDFSTTKKLIFESKKVNIASLSKKNKAGLEETGRKVRYDFFKSLAKKYKATHLLTAHQADENLETIILNFLRGAGIKGLQGIPKIDILQGTKAIILRPILNISKKQIAEYLKLKNIKYRTDKSNFDPIYKRNLIRFSIIPELKKINPSIVETVSKNTENLKEIQDFLECESKKWLKNNLKKNTFSAKKFTKLPIALQKTIIRTIYQNTAQTTQNLESSHIEEILRILNQPIGNKKKTILNLEFSTKRQTIKIKKVF